MAKETVVVTDLSGEEAEVDGLAVGGKEEIGRPPACFPQMGKKQR